MVTRHLLFRISFVLALLALTLLIPLRVEAKGFRSYDQSIFGRWRFVKMIAKNSEIAQDPKLEIIFDLQPPNLSNLYLTNDGSKTFCEARGVFDWDGHLLTNQIEWINPRSRPSCDHDPSLQIGRKKQIPAWIYNDLLHLDLGVGPESVIYVWKRSR